jgi:hypothetical protein
VERLISEAITRPVEREHGEAVPQRPDNEADMETTAM